MSSDSSATIGLIKKGWMCRRICQKILIAYLQITKCGTLWVHVDTKVFTSTCHFIKTYGTTVRRRFCAAFCIVVNTLEEYGHLFEVTSVSLTSMGSHSLEMNNYMEWLNDVIICAASLVSNCKNVSESMTPGLSKSLFSMPLSEDAECLSTFV